MEDNKLKIGSTYSSGAKAGIQLQFNRNDYLGEVVFWCDNTDDLKAENCGEWGSYPLAKERAEKIVKSYNEYDTLVKERELLIGALKIYIANDTRSDMELWCNEIEWDKINKAKELLNNLQK